MLRILADENMPGLEVFRALGTLTCLPGRQITTEDLREIDILLIRSVTTVNETLLRGTPVRFVGSATIGTDHVDLAWLAKAGIHFANAPGCNAQAVAEYVLQAVLLWCQKTGREPSGLSLGIVGLGNVGSRVAGLADALGLSVRVSDPPRLAREGQLRWLHERLDRVLACDVVTLHVPLTHQGAHATRHLLDDAALARFHAGQLLINTCRGSVIDNVALVKQLQAQPFDCVLDVWEGEPVVMPALLDRVWLGSPHVAGYSHEGKLRGTGMLFEALTAWLEQPAARPALPAMGELVQSLDSWKDVLAWLRQVYRLEADDRRLRASVLSKQPGEAFDQLRKQYALRHELSVWQQQGTVVDSLQNIARLLAGK